MARSKGMAGMGTKLGYSLTKAGVPTYIAEILSAKPPGGGMGNVELTNMDSTQQEFDSDGVAISDQATFQCNHTGVDFSALNGVEKVWTILYKDGTKDQWIGYINKFGKDQVERNKTITTSVTIQESCAFASYVDPT
jgi:hypothetical protein